MQRESRRDPAPMRLGTVLRHLVIWHLKGLPTRPLRTSGSRDHPELHAPMTRYQPPRRRQNKGA